MHSSNFKKKLVSAGAISLGTLLLTQLIRFLGNIISAKLLAPESFGLIAIVNTILFGISLFSDIGLKQVVIQKKEELTPEFLNTIWVMQVIRGGVVWLVALLAVGFLLVAQNTGLVWSNVYANPLLPYLTLFAALSALIDGFNSTKLVTAARTMSVGRINLIGVVSQILSLSIIVVVAKLTASPWALVLGTVSGALFQCLASHYFLPGVRNGYFLDKELALAILKKGKWILLSSPLTFLELNGAVLILGTYLGASDLGLFMIAFLIIGVVHLISQNLAGSIFFPGLSQTLRENPSGLGSVYRKFQLIADAIIVTAAGGLLAAGPSIVALLFDQRYAVTGQLLSILAIGLIGVRYCVVEQLINAHGDFKFGPPTILSRVLVMLCGVTIGFQLGGLQGAALGISASWFAGWPLLLWYRSQKLPVPWHIEAVAILFFGLGYGLGLLLVEILQWLQTSGWHPHF